MAPGFDAARRVLADAIRARVFPAAVVDVGSSAGPIWQDALGTLSFDADASPALLDTPFDLASLTKPLATASVLMQLVAAGAVTLAGPVSSSFPEWTGADRQDVTTADLLEHASGLSPRLLDTPPLGRREFEHEICTAPLEYAPRSRSIYSDLGFILLGFLAEDRGGTTLANQFEAIATGVGAPLTYGLPEERRREAAPTTPLPEDVRRGRVLVGEVHDNYAAALGGIAGHRPEPDSRESGRPLSIRATDGQPRVPAASPHHGADPVELVPTVRSEPTDLRRQHLLRQASGLQEGDPAHLSPAGRGERDRIADSLGHDRAVGGIPELDSRTGSRAPDPARCADHRECPVH